MGEQRTKYPLIIGVIILLLGISFVPVSVGLTKSNEDIFPEILDIPYQDGWPQETTGRVDSSPVIADLDDDGMPEIIVGSGATGDNKFKVYVFHSDGSIMDGWPVPISGEIYGSPAVGDLDKDGDFEIIIGCFGSFIYVWHHDGTIVDGWPQKVDYITASPTLADIDNDGDLEIITGTTGVANSRSCARVDVWHHDGTDADGWPILITDYNYSSIEYSSPAVGDIDGDEDVEIIVGIRTQTVPRYDGYIYAWHHDGALVDGWPFCTGQVGEVFSSPALGDLDGDNDLEIIASSDNGHVWALHHDGSNVSGWPKYIPSWIRSQALADVDNDGILEVISGAVDTKSVYVWDNNGLLADGWPQTTNGFVYESPIVGDVAGDERLEIIATSFDYNVYAWHHNGTMVSGFPLETGNKISSTPCIGDIDKDGDLELIVGSKDKKLHVWDLPHPYDSDTMEWPMFQHDTHHTGLYVRLHDANQPPENLTISGPSSGKVGDECHYSFSAVDPEKNNISYYIDWDDDSHPGWTWYKPSGEEIYSSHIWTKTGTYEIKVKAKDEYDHESDWATLEVTMPKNRLSNNPLFLQFMEKLLPHFPLLARIF